MYGWHRFGREKKGALGCSKGGAIRSVCVSCLFQVVHAMQFIEEGRLSDIFLKERERARERERERERHTHTHTERESERVCARERERERKNARGGSPAAHHAHRLPFTFDPQCTPREGGRDLMLPMF